MNPVYYYGFAEYFHKPRPGVKPHALGVDCPDDNAIRPDFPACKHHEYRWEKNLKTWWQWHFKQGVTDRYRKYIRVPFGSLRKPAPIEWRDYFDGMADKIIPCGEPVCPYCGEMPYSYEQCVFCGQRFLTDESGNDNTAPQREMREGEPIIFMDGICPECGCSSGNGGYGSLRCRCGWVGHESSAELKKAINELFTEEFEESDREEIQESREEDDYGNG